MVGDRTPNYTRWTTIHAHRRDAARISVPLPLSFYRALGSLGCAGGSPKPSQWPPRRRAGTAETGGGVRGGAARTDRYGRTNRGWPRGAGHAAEGGGQPIGA